ncbi:MAG: low temperature requirement protein A [Actinomycetota bacterium]|nr:low temperature requirement protein A [Actinomycetota bacterium]
MPTSSSVSFISFSPRSSLATTPTDEARLVRFAPTAILGASLLLLAGFLDGDERLAVWVVALAIDYLGPVAIGVGRGWRVAPEHFAERYGLIVLIALGESLIAIGVGAGFELDAGVIAAAALGIVVVSALWWLYFDVAALFARRRLSQAEGLELHRLAPHSYSYLHLPMVAGIVLFALGLKTIALPRWRRSTQCPQSVSAAVPPSTCSRTSPSSSERPVESSGDAR